MSNTFPTILTNDGGSNSVINYVPVSPAFPQFVGVAPPVPLPIGIALIPIHPLPGNAGTGSWAISLFWTLPLVPLMAKLFLLSALGMR